MNLAPGASYDTCLGVTTALQFVIILIKIKNLTSMQNLFSKLPYQITGDSYEQLKKYDPNSRKKVNILGWFAFIPSFLWFMSCFLLCHNILITGLGIALLSGIVAAIVIFIFERNIVQSVKTHWILTSLRVLLGLLIAVFSSVILDLVIFKNDIDHFAQVKMISREEEKVKEATSSLQTATARLNNEMEGASDSKRKGFGRIAKEKKEQVLEEKNKLASLESGLVKIKFNIADTSNLQAKQMEIGLGLNTILNRVKLLHEFVSQNILAFWAWFILLLIGILLEVFGVLTKCFYPKSSYEEDLEAIRTMMANKRRMVLEQSIYYTNLGVTGREALDKMKNRNQSILN